MRLYNTLSRDGRGVRPRRRPHRAHVHVRADRLRARAHRQFPDVRQPRRAAARAAAPGGLRDAPGHELHGRRRQDHRRVRSRPASRCATTPTSTSRRFSRMRRRWASSRSRRIRARPTTPNLRAMVDMVSALEARGHTYRSDGSVYFRIATLPDYGKLARLDHEGIQAGARVDADTYAKQDARDFVLWKATKPGEPTWDCGCGPGRPGWHIECSAMALRLLGEPPIDIHGGGIDLIFPHHENEIAQAEGATGTPFVALLGARRVPEPRQREDVEVARQRLHGARHSRQRLPRVGAAVSADLGALPQATHVQLGRARAGRGGRDAARGLPRARRGRVAAARRIRAIAARVATAREEFRAMIASDLNVPGAHGVMFDLVREMNAAIDQGQVGRAGCAGDSRGVRRVRPRARRAGAAARGRRRPAGAGRGDRGG